MIPQGFNQNSYDAARFPYQPYQNYYQAGVAPLPQYNTPQQGYSLYNYNPQQNFAVNQALMAKYMPVRKQGYTEQTFDIPFYDFKGKLYKLDSGQNVVIIPKPGPTMIKTFVNVGSFNEPENLKGISHYIEHNLFNGSKSMPNRQFDEIIAETGARYNAGTDMASTSYYILSPFNNYDTLDKLLKAHGEMMRHPVFDEAMLEKEKGPVTSEIQMYRDDPSNKASNLLLKNLFRIQEKTEDLIAGSEDIINGMTREKVSNYFNKWYTPDNMTTVIVGEVNSDQILKLVQKYFDPQDYNIPEVAQYQDKNPKYHMPLDKPTQIPVRADMKHPNVKSVSLGMAFVGPKNNDIRDSVSTEALCYALNGFENARLSKVLKTYNTQAASSLNIVSSAPEAPQVVQISTVFSPGQEEDGLKAIYSSITDVAKRPLSPDELNIVKNKMKESLINSSETSSDITELVGNALSSRKDLASYTEKLKMIDELRPEDIQRAANNYLNLNKVSIVMVHPEDSTLSPTKPIFSGKISFSGNSKPFDSSNIIEWDLPNKLHLVLNNDDSAIKTSTILRFQTNAIPVVKPGIYDILGLMLYKGTKNLSEEKLNDIIDSNNLAIGIDTAPDSIIASTETQDKNLPMALDIIKEILYNPDFTQEKLDKAREEVRIGYLSQTETPVNQAIEELYGNHPYGITPRKVLESIDSITLQDVKDFYNYIMTNSQAGATTTAKFKKNPEIGTILIEGLGVLPVAQKSHYININVPDVLPANRVVVHPENREQADIIQMTRIKESGNVKDQAALMVFNEILGGNSSSRLFQDLREKQKLAYRVNSTYTTDGKHGDFLINIKTTTEGNPEAGLISKHENVQKSLEGFKEHINRLATVPVSQKELDAAKKAIEGALILDSETSARKTAKIMKGYNTYYGRAYNQELLKAVENITPQDIEKAATVFFKKPMVISVLASENTLKNTKNYLATKGSVKEW